MVVNKMLYKWEQLRYERGELSRWRLVNKETGQVVLELRLSNHGEAYWNYKVRKKKKRIYEQYHVKVWFNKLRF